MANRGTSVVIADESHKLVLRNIVYCSIVSSHMCDPLLLDYKYSHDVPTRYSTIIVRAQTQQKLKPKTPSTQIFYFSAILVSFLSFIMDLSTGCTRGKQCYAAKMLPQEQMWLPLGTCTKTLGQAVFEQKRKQAEETIRYRYGKTISRVAYDDLVRQELNRLDAADFAKNKIDITHKL